VSRISSTTTKQSSRRMPDDEITKLYRMKAESHLIKVRRRTPTWPGAKFKSGIEMN